MAARKESYKDLQRSFMSNLTGTTTFEISLVTSCAPVSVLFRSLLWNLIVGKCQNTREILQVSSIFFVEYLTVVSPTLLTFTHLANHAFTLMLVLLTIVLIPNVMGSSFQLPKKNLDSLLWHKKPFLCNFRAYVNIATAISILAVDFVIFPRRFAKTETYGTGLMDIGVGSFIISNAIVCQDARETSTGSSSFVLSVKKEFRAVSLLLGLGLMRFVAVKSTDYQEHVSEYGVHWNFFLTLASVRVVSTIILKTLPCYLNKNSWIVGLFIGLSYHYILSNGLEDFVINGSHGDGSRSNLIDANREGICSCLGYLSLYFIGVGIGKLIFRKQHTSLKSATELLFRLVSVDVISWFVLFYWKNNVGMISRRLANFPFVLWQVCHNLQLLAMFLAVDIVLAISGIQNMFVQYPGGCSFCLATKQNSPEAKTSTTKTNSGEHVNCLTKKDLHDQLPDPSIAAGPLGTVHSPSNSKEQVLGDILPRKAQHVASKNVSAVAQNLKCFCLITALNFNQLGYFLIANLLTGAVNLSLRTIDASPLTAFLVVNSYMIVLSCIILVLYKHKIMLKL